MGISDPDKLYEIIYDIFNELHLQGGHTLSKILSSRGYSRTKKIHLLTRLIAASPPSERDYDF